MLDSSWAIQTDSNGLQTGQTCIQSLTIYWLFSLLWNCELSIYYSQMQMNICSIKCIVDKEIQMIDDIDFVHSIIIFLWVRTRIDSRCICQGITNLRLHNGCIWWRWSSHTQLTTHCYPGWNKTTEKGKTTTSEEITRKASYWLYKRSEDLWQAMKTFTRRTVNRRRCDSSSWVYRTNDQKEAAQKNGKQICH